MDVDKAVGDLSEFIESVESFELDDIDPRNIAQHPQAKLISWFFVYLFLKVIFRAMYGGAIWDETSLVHNIVSVALGLYDLFFWDIPFENTCDSFLSRASLSIVLQLIHCMSDFIVFIPEMLADMNFFWHHFILVFTSLILPYCPGCYYVVIAYTLAEAGSASIAIDQQWRKSGRVSRGLKRVIVFGGTRLINIVLLYRIYLVTPSSVYFTLSSADDDRKILSFNFPICMITSVGGSILILMVNFVTWYRMYKTYVKNRIKRKGSKHKKAKNE